MSETNEQRYLRLHWQADRRFPLRVWTLAHNLATGGALCIAAKLGPIARHPNAHEPHEYAESTNEYDCAICGEGFCYYLHTDRPEYEP